MSMIDATSKTNNLEQIGNKRKCFQVHDVCYKQACPSGNTNNVEQIDNKPKCFQVHYVCYKQACPSGNTNNLEQIYI